jgi:YgiT-type zinc finger domain-containing protein
MTDLKECPTCGSRRIKKVRRDVVRQYRDQSYKVPKLTFYECPDCHEKVYDPDAVGQIQSYSPAYRQPHQKRRSA